MNDRTVPGLLCPTCRVDLTMTDRQGVEIDFCPKCRGVWLDRGELDKIVERSAAYEAPPRAPEYPPRHAADYPYGERGEHGEYGERGYRGKHGRPYKRKSFLDEIFDF